jgi:hypothetical protein
VTPLWFGKPDIANAPRSRAAEVECNNKTVLLWQVALTCGAADGSDNWADMVRGGTTVRAFTQQGHTASGCLERAVGAGGDEWWNEGDVKAN